jgi:hypothetical protein
VKKLADDAVLELCVTSNPTTYYLSTIIISILIVLLSTVSLAFPERIYVTLNLQQTLLTNDAVNLIINIPILFGTMFWARRGKLIGLLF